MPERARPVSARSVTEVVQSGEKEAANVAAEGVVAETVMIAFRPNASGSVPAQSIATPNSPVAADNERLAAAGEIEKARAKPGIIGRTQ